jgi:hypothetical protein
MIRLHAHPLPPLSPSVSGPATHRKTEKESQLADGRGVGAQRMEPSHTTAGKPGPLEIFPSFPMQPLLVLR